MTFSQSANGNRRSSIRRTGFTLVELLVVISIIALLLSILMPALSQVKKKAQSVICRNNLRQIGIGSLMYAQNNKDAFVPYYSGNGIDQKSWMVKLIKDRHFYTDNQIAYISGIDILFCPSHKLPIPPPINTYNTHEPKLYAIAAGTISYGMSIVLATDPVTSLLTPVKLTQILQPASTIEMTDTMYKDPSTKQVTGCFYLRPYYNYGMANATARHEGACDVLWVDGHVTSVKAANAKDERAIYDQKALTDSSMTSNYWDWK
jgi:prepilin-type N-terminal cleavage/methylation domain-containing protein/prepilin-type processing-associated H-X9-DG protein